MCEKNSEKLIERYANKIAFKDVDVQKDAKMRTYLGRTEKQNTTNDTKP